MMKIHPLVSKDSFKPYKLGIKMKLKNYIMESKQCSNTIFKIQFYHVTKKEKSYKINCRTT